MYIEQKNPLGTEQINYYKAILRVSVHKFFFIIPKRHTYVYLRISTL